MADERQQMDMLLEGQARMDPGAAIPESEMDMQLINGVLQLMGDPDGSLAEAMAMVRSGQPLNDDQRRSFSTMIIENIDVNPGMTDAERAIQQNNQFNQRAQDSQATAIRNAQATRMDPGAAMTESEMNAMPPMPRPTMIGK